MRSTTRRACSDSGSPPIARAPSAALRTIVEIGLATCTRALAAPDASVSVTLGGSKIVVSSRVTGYQSLWLDTICAAMIVRDHASVGRLAGMPLDAFIPNSDGRVADFAYWLHAHVRGTPARMMSPGGDRVPTRELVEAVLCGDAVRYGETLATMLRWRRERYDQPDHASRPEQLISLAQVALCVVAHDCGLPCPVRSGYVPGWLVDGSALEATCAR